MPVIEHEIHPSVRHGAEKRYGCWNLPRPVENSLVVGAEAYGAQTWPFCMSTECRFDLSLSDPWCEGCDHQGSGETYAATIRMEGKA